MKKPWIIILLVLALWPLTCNAENAAGGNMDKSGPFAIGAPNDAYAKYFVGQSFLNRLTTSGVPIANVTFEPACRNNWHIHKAEKGGGQILLCTSGHGWYQEWGKPAQALKAGDVVQIPANTKHWHGAAKDSWFAHLSVEVPGEKTSNEWLEPVNPAEYDSLVWRERENGAQ